MDPGRRSLLMGLAPGLQGLPIGDFVYVGAIRELYEVNGRVLPEYLKDGEGELVAVDTSVFVNVRTD